MLGLELIVVLGVALLLCGALARRYPVAPAILLLLAGVLIGFIPRFREAQLPPEVVLLVFLPALLYWESLTTSLREIRSNLSVVALTSTALVVLTAGAVAWVAHARGLPWGPAWVLGAAVAPTDATAVGVLARALPRRTVTVLKAESLVNDGTALVIFAVAVGVTVGQETLAPLHLTWLVVLSYAGGILAGLIIGWASSTVRRRISDPTLENIAVLVTPFAAFLLAEIIGASGVLAVVTCGLWMSQTAPRITSAAARQQMIGFWSLATTVLSSALFVLVGLQAQSAVRNLRSESYEGAVVDILVVGAVVIGTRWVWTYTTPYIIRLFDRRPSQRVRRVGARQRMVTANAGFRGAVSLAVALAIPQRLDSGEPFPGRDLVIVITCGVIVLTLLQALWLPLIVRAARLPADTSVDQERKLAETVTADAAYDAIDEIGADLGSSKHVIERVRHEMDKRRRLLSATDDGNQALVQHHDQYTALRLALLARERETLIALRDQRQIDDIVLRQVQARLDIEEVQLSRSMPAE